MLRLPFNAPLWVLAVFRPHHGSDVKSSAPPVSEPFVEHDPRKLIHDPARNVTPVHLLAAGGRGEVFRIRR